MSGTTTTEPAATAGTKNRRNPLWWIVLVAFAVQLAGWAVWLVIASHHRVAEVPLETRSAR